MDRKKTAARVSYANMALNAALAVLKLTAGFTANSGAMISDAVNSISDVVRTAGAMIGISISERKSDSSHRYGHERFECIFSILLAVMLFMTGAGIGYSGIMGIIGHEYETPGMLALIAAAVTVPVKEIMYRFTMRAAKKINSTALKADAWDHRSDVFAELGIMAGIGGSMLGFPILDPIASVIICIFIVKAAFDVFKEATDRLVDRACDEETEFAIRTEICGCEGVKAVDLLNTRLFGSRMYVDVEIAVNGDLSLRAAHEIAENVHHSIESAFPEVKHCMVHVNPYGEG